MAQPDLAGPCRDTWEPIFECPLPIGSEIVSGAALQVATDILWGLSGRQFGLCTKLLRPCRRECFEDVWSAYAGWRELSGGTSGSWGWPFPALVGGEWLNLACGSCGGGCSCARVSEVTLPGLTYDVTQVRVDGVTLTPGVDYRLDSARLLVRLGGDDWPLCNDLNLDDTQVGTWSVTSRVGRPLSPLGQLALGVLTMELVKSMLCDASCALPQRVQSVSRQGVELTMLDPGQVFDNGLTGLRWPDLFIQTVNPHRITRRARAYDIDRRDNRRLTNVPPVS